MRRTRPGSTGLVGGGARTIRPPGSSERANLLVAPPRTGRRGARARGPRASQGRGRRGDAGATAGVAAAICGAGRRRRRRRRRRRTPLPPTADSYRREKRAPQRRLIIGNCDFSLCTNNFLCFGVGARTYLYPIVDIKFLHILRAIQTIDDTPEIVSQNYNYIRLN